MSKVWAVAAAVAATLVLVGGCGFADSSTQPGAGAGLGTSTGAVTTPVETSPEPTVLRSLDYTLYTHCGIHFASFDGRVWTTAPRSDGSGNPPAGWGNPVQAGRVDILSEHSAVFTAPGLPPLVFHPTDAQPPMCD